MSHTKTLPKLNTRYRYIGNTLQFQAFNHPKNIFIVRRFYGDTFNQYLKVLKYISENYLNHVLYVENKEREEIDKSIAHKDSKNLESSSLKNTLRAKFMFIDTDNIKSQETQNNLTNIHLVITIGGDGTLLYAASLFQKPNTYCPPFLPIALGSLGFLTPIKFENTIYEKAITRILSENVRTRSDTLEFNQENLMDNTNTYSNSLACSSVEVTPNVSMERPAPVPPYEISYKNEDENETFEHQNSLKSQFSSNITKKGARGSLPVPRLRSNIPETDLFNSEEPLFVTKRIRLYVKVRDLSKSCSITDSVSSSSLTSTVLSSDESASFESPTSLASVQSQGTFTSSSSRRFVLNEVVIDRGPNHGMVHLEIFINDKMIADVRGDGLIISTPTGSTAYSLSAGASIVHPSSVGVIITPICPHSLSLRPLVIPPGVKLVIKPAGDNRNQPWVSFDGRDAHSLDKNTEISVILPEKVEDHGGFIIPCICYRDPVDDFFSSLATGLSWNSSSFVAKGI